jgi:hypothetical protein
MDKFIFNNIEITINNLGNNNDLILDDNGIAWKYFLEIINITIKNNLVNSKLVKNLLNYFGIKELWRMDLEFAVYSSNDIDKKHINDMLIYIINNVKDIDSKYIQIMINEYVNPLIALSNNKLEKYDGKNDYRIEYTSVDIPDIINFK